MKVPGPKTLFSLEAPTQTRTTTGGVTNAWAELTTFNAHITGVAADEVNTFGREAEVFTHLCTVGSEEVGSDFHDDMKAKNRLVATNAGNNLAAQTFDIVGVFADQYPGVTIAKFEVMLREVL